METLFLVYLHHLKGQDDSKSLVISIKRSATFSHYFIEREIDQLTVPDHILSPYKTESCRRIVMLFSLLPLSNSITQTFAENS